MSLLTKSISHGRCLITSVTGVNKYLAPTVTATQIRGYAARKGTRERKKKQKAGTEDKKVGFIPHNQREKDNLLVVRKQRKFDDSWKALPTENVYVQKYYRWRVYPFTDAVQCHRETHHPEMYNQPNASLHVTVELNMAAEKKNRFLDNFTRIVSVPHKFDHGEERTVIAFTKTPELQEQITQAGAQLAGGVELIKQIQNGAVNVRDFRYIISHPNILHELLVLRGLMKKRFPTAHAGTLKEDLMECVQKFLHGICYQGVADEYEKDFGSINTVIGTLDMKSEHLEENFAALVRDIHQARPRKSGTFITRCLLTSPPSSEKLKVDHRLYLESEQKETQENDLEQEAVKI